MSTVFSAQMDWDQPFISRRSYVTDVITAYNGTEQRAGIIVIPRRQIEFNILVAEARDTQWIDALLYAGQNEQWAVPFWPHVTRLTASAASGSNVVLSVSDTTSREFKVGGQLILYGDEHTTELCTISATSATSLTVSTLASNWSAQSRVFPAMIGYWGVESLDELRPANWATGFPVVFDVVPGANPSVSTPATAALYTVLPNRRDEPTDALRRGVERITSPSSTFTEYSRTTVPFGTRAYLFSMDTKAAVVAFNTWYDGIKGRLARFLFPTYQNDLNILSGLGTSTITISPINYTTRLFPLGTRSRIAAFAPDGSITTLTVSSASVTGSTETLNLSGTIPANTVMVSFLLTVRLSTDTVETRWLTTELSEVLLPMVECPA